MEIQQPRKILEEIIWIQPKVNGLELKMELETGSALSIISKTNFVKYLKGMKWEKNDLTIKTYS